MTSEVYKKLKKFEGQLNSALHYNFARMRPGEVEEVSEALREHRGTPLTKQERTCSHCFLTAMKKLAADYFKFKDSPWGKKIDKGEDTDEETRQEGSLPAGQGGTETQDAAQD